MIMVLFFIMGLTGVFYDYSLNTGGDESVLMAATIKMVSDHTLRPNYPTFYHVPLAVYFYLPAFILLFVFLRLTGIFTSLNALKEFGVLNPYSFLPFARLITVIMAAIAIYFLYKIAQKLFNNKLISLFTAFLLSSSFMFVQLSHLARVWIPQTMVILLTFYLIILLYKSQENKIKDYLFAGLGVGLALGVHVIGIIVYAPFFIAHYLKNEAKKFKDIFIKNKYFWLVNITIIIFYLFIFYLNPHGFKNYINRDGKIWPNFSFLFASSPIADNNASNSLFFNVFVWFKKFGYHTGVLIEYDPIMVLLSIAGGVILFLRERKIFYILISFILTYYIGATFAGLIPYYILPIIPFLALMAGYGLYYFYKKISTIINRPAAFALVSIILILNFMPPLIWNYRIIQPGARLTARDWIYKNIFSGSSIINFDTLLELNENQSSLADIKKFADSHFTAKRAYLLSKPAGEYPQPNYYVLYYDYSISLLKESLNKKFDYILISWNDKADLKNKLDQAKIFKLNLTLLKRFPEAADENSSYKDWRDMNQPLDTIIHDNIRAPIIDIYKLK